MIPEVANHLISSGGKRLRPILTIAMAKLVTSEANLTSALSAVQIFGGRGYMREAGLEKELRAAVGAPIYSGTNEMQRIRIASMLGLIRPGWKSF